MAPSFPPSLMVRSLAPSLPPSHMVRFRPSVPPCVMVRFSPSLPPLVVGASAWRTSRFVSTTALPSDLQSLLDRIIKDEADMRLLQTILEADIRRREVIIEARENLITERQVRLEVEDFFLKQTVTETLKLKGLLHMQGLLEYFIEKINVPDCPEASIDEKYLYALDAPEFQSIITNKTLRQCLRAHTNWRDKDMVKKLKQIYLKLSSSIYGTLNEGLLRTHVEIIKGGILTLYEVAGLVCVAEALYVQYKVVCLSIAFEN